MKRFIVALCASVLVLMACGTGGGAVVPPRVERTEAPRDKRGVSYSFEQDKTAAEDMALLSSANGIKWYYNWYIQSHADADAARKQHNVAYYPMVWNSWEFEELLEPYLAANPDIEYIMGFNEPNLTDQSNMTPKEAAKHWPKLVRFAKKHNLKIVSPAMNYGTLQDYWVPWVWLDEFFGIDRIDEETGRVIRNRGFPGVSLEDIDAISIHCYMPDAGAMKWFISNFKRYNKPIWMTEFCSWENTDSIEWQMAFMSEAITYMELDPDVEKYAWFIPKGSEPETEKPMNKLLTKTVLPEMAPPRLTPLGEVFVNMGTCDKTVFVPAGERITAAHFTDCILSDYINSEFEEGRTIHWPRQEQGFTKGSGVHFRPGTDEGGAPLDMFDFTNMKWVEYQVETPEAKTYTLSLRNTAEAETEMEIQIDGAAPVTVTLNQNSAWTTTDVPLQMEAGRHTIRLTVKSGDCALNWLRIE